MQEGGERGQKISAEGTVRLSADISTCGGVFRMRPWEFLRRQQGRPLPQQLCEFWCSGEGAFGPAAAAEPALGVVKSHLNSLVVTCCD